jgi:mono/diheme cytochrome c family protein
LSFRLCVVVTLATTGLVAACSDDGGGGGDQSLPGAAIFRASCASCHGSSGEGGFGRKIDDGLLEQRYPDIEDQMTVIREGNGSMPAWGGKLTEEQIRQVAEYTRTL